MPRRLVALLVALLGAVACQSTRVERDRVDQPEYTAPDGSYRLALPLGWWRDGNTLTAPDGDQTIAFNAGPVLAGVDPRAVDAGTPELIAAMEAELAAQPGVRVVDCSAARVGGLPGFRMHFVRATDSDEREQLIVGAISGATLFAFSYEAASGAAFAAQTSTFEGLVESFEPFPPPR